MLSAGNLYLIILVAVAAVCGAAEPLLEDRALSVPSAFAVMIILYLWCKAHVAQFRINEPSASATFCGLLNIIGVVVYFYRAFGLKSGSIKSLKAIVFYVFLSFLYSALAIFVEDLTV